MLLAIKLPPMMHPTKSRPRSALCAVCRSAMAMAFLVVPAAADTDCTIGGYHVFDSPSIFYFRGDMVVGETLRIPAPNQSQIESVRSRGKTITRPTLRIYDRKRHSLGAPIQIRTPGLTAVSAGASLGNRAYIGGEEGLFTSLDLQEWEPVSSFAGRKVSKMLGDGSNLWIGIDGEIVRLQDERIVARHPYDGDAVVSLTCVGEKLLIGTIKKVPPPSGFCEPFLAAEGLLALDVPSGKTMLLQAPSKPREAAAVEVRLSSAIGAASVVFSDNLTLDVTYLLESNSNRLTRAMSKISPSFPRRWLHEHQHQSEALKDLMPLVELLYVQSDYLWYWHFWRDVLTWLGECAEFNRLKRIYIGTNLRNKEQLIKLLGLRDDNFARELLTLAIDRHEYFREELARTVDRHKATIYDKLLLRILRESASIEPESIGKNIIVPFPCPAGQAADALLRRMGDSAIPTIQQVAEMPSTRPIVRESLEHRLRNWTYSTHRRTYKTTIQVKAEHASGAEAVAMLDDDDPYVRFQAIQNLKATPDLVPLAKLVSLLGDTNDVATHAAIMIGLSKASGATEALLKALDSSHKNPIRVWAMISLGKRQDHRAYAPMVASLSDRNADIRSAAAKGLGDLGDVSAIPKLKTLLQDENYVVRNSASESIRKLEGRP